MLRGVECTGANSWSAPLQLCRIRTSRTSVLPGGARHADPDRTSQIERYNYFFEQFANRGVSVFSYDQRGFGRTGQKTDTFGVTDMVKQLADMEFFLAKEEERLKGSGVPIFLFGHSMVSCIFMFTSSQGGPRKTDNNASNSDRAEARF